MQQITQANLKGGMMLNYLLGITIALFLGGFLYRRYLEKQEENQRLKKRQQLMEGNNSLSVDKDDDSVPSIFPLYKLILITGVCVFLGLYLYHGNYPGKHFVQTFAGILVIAINLFGLIMLLRNIRGMLGKRK